MHRAELVNLRDDPRAMRTVMNTFDACFRVLERGEAFGEADTDPGVTGYPGGAEIFVISGSFADENGRYTEGYWLRFPCDATHHPHTSTGCILYVKKGGLKYLVHEDV